ncbi:HupE/UreJ protein [Actinocorallia herbida]|uniref:HupE/UreJ protein n=1 Tax=Actinocorallia herbida TaxID=58109 RepID=A0A3N1CSV3_9ACTN|nr:HupE/UreJ family protein [Actinocorallia herbida]ROO84254.1 HupE/UreJ protein [Actinocorallia herbida]
MSFAARVGAVVTALVAFVLVSAGPVSAHGFTSTVYADLTAPAAGRVRVDLGLEYDLLVVSAADAGKDDALFRAGDGAFQNGDPMEQAAALDAHAASVVAYVADRFKVTAEGAACTAVPDGGFAIERREGVPYARLALGYRCPEAASAHEVRVGLFPDAEGYVKGVKTIVTYDLDLTSGSAALDGQHPSFSTRQSPLQRFWEFFRLGAEHLLLGFDHILFLLALIAGSRRVREMIFAATAFTLAHSVTFALAALGVVAVPAGFVEPVIALSISVVAGWHLWRLWRHRSHAADLAPEAAGRLGLDAAGWTRLAVVFCFGLVHGLGFASALGIQQAWSWTLLWSLLVFNVGIEAAQLAIIALVFPVLAYLRTHRPAAGLRTTGGIAAGVSAMGLFWFMRRTLGM